MDILNTVIFYILSIICIISGAFSLFQKDTINAAISAIVFFWAVSGFYFLLHTPLFGAVQILAWGVGSAVLMLFCATMTNDKKEKTGFLFNLKTLFTPIVSVTFAALIIPFIIYQFSGIKTVQEHNMKAFAETLFKNNAFTFELMGLLIFGTIIGIAAIIISKGTLSAAKQAAKKLNDKDIRAIMKAKSENKEAS